MPEAPIISRGYLLIIKRILEVKERREVLRNKLERKTAARLEKVKEEMAKIARL
ncbi:hypothetical protein K432DRAFT_410930 [Lepidopterella palustris CBS 459.81]|uniref:Uncharacterized protein n=1 Tax=Lepidopterella palustris CBS 459.81 TaxID=1314670 RepID=A0A8E2DWZ7_9PEZI|nr:hypothetical protein K432DRAFT_410930 [Lepidopterella palustris CBS 459.81]